jgi:hypothetical protein
MFADRLRYDRAPFHARIFLRRVIFRQGPFGQGKFDLLLLPCNHIMRVDQTVGKPPLNPEKPPRRRRGRPTREEAARRALAELGLDPRLLDPRRVLAAIAADADAPATARVNAARALLRQRDQGQAETKGKDKPGTKKAAAARAAAAAGGPASQWGSDLWPDGRRPP